MWAFLTLCRSLSRGGHALWLRLARRSHRLPPQVVRSDRLSEVEGLTPITNALAPTVKMVAGGDKLLRRFVH